VRILGLDFGGTTGWAVVGADGPVAFGTWDIAPRRGESHGVRYLRLRGYLLELLAAFPDVRLAVYEQSHHRGGPATEYAAGCVSTLQGLLEERRQAGRPIDEAVVHTATLKKHAAGRGNADKAEMIAAAAERLASRQTRGLVNEHSADALHVAFWALDAYERVKA